MKSPTWTRRASGKRPGDTNAGRYEYKIPQPLELGNSRRYEMGMDVFGKQPENHHGEYFRASIWTWPAVYSLTLTLCSDLLDEETMQGMAVNDGVGPDDGEVCKQMAVRVQDWLQENPGGYRVMVDHERTLEGKVAQQLQQAGFEVCLHVPTASREADQEHLQEWATFLQHCGGFSVW